MSAFLCENKTINQIVSNMPEEPWKLITEACLLTTNETLGKAMFDLNCYSLDQRYGEGEHQSFGSDEGYEYSQEDCTPEQFSKSLHCFLYQSCEGDADKNTLYLVLSEISDGFDVGINTNSEAYEAATWG